jgi:hypothetical protein
MPTQDKPLFKRCTRHKADLIPVEDFMRPNLKVRNPTEQDIREWDMCNKCAVERQQYMKTRKSRMHLTQEDIDAEFVKDFSLISPTSIWLSRPLIQDDSNDELQKLPKTH